MFRCCPDRRTRRDPPLGSVPVSSFPIFCVLCVPAFSSPKLSPFNSKLSTFSCFSPNSHRITSFADPHPLTSMESHSYKKQGGGVPSPRPHTSKISPNHFHSFPQGARIAHAASPATPIPSVRYAQFPSHPGWGSIHRKIPRLPSHPCTRPPARGLLLALQLFASHLPPTVFQPGTSTRWPRIYGIIPPHCGTSAFVQANERNSFHARGGLSD
jgi:hypothetical protein